MRKIRDILRLKAEGRRHRHIARALKVGVGTVSEVVRRAATAGLDWAGVEELGEAELEAAVYGEVSRKLRAPLPDPAWMDRELKRIGVTLQLLHVEYRESHPDGYGYTQFCEHYRRWKKRQSVVMRQVHRAGEKMFADFSGKKPHWIDPATGEVREVELFVAVLGASNYTYAEATESQRLPYWLAANTRALEYCRGVPELVIPDQLRAAVSEPCRYEPGLQRTFEEWGAHYGTVILPARQRKPRDKAAVEAGVLVAQRWILARLRNQTFFSRVELNARIAELLDDLNTRVMRRYGKSRRELFEELERPALKALPAQRFTYAEWKGVRLSAMLAAWQEQNRQSDMAQLGFDERFGLLVEAEWLHRDNQRMARNLREAKLRLSQATLEDIDYPARRELDRSQIRQLATCRWVKEHQNVLISGATGTGKTFVACALAHPACRHGYRALYRRTSRLFDELTLARADGTCAHLLARLARFEVLVIDDFALAPLDAQHRQDLLEVLEDRHAVRSTIVASQLPAAQWHPYIDDPTLADAICDRLLHNAHRLVLKGPSRRKQEAPAD